MKKSIFVFAMAFATVSFSANKSFAASSFDVVLQDDAKKERITAEQLPAEVVSAWTQSDNAQTQVSEINKVTKGEEVWYEVTYATADGTNQTAKYKADGTEVKDEQK